MYTYTYKLTSLKYGQTLDPYSWDKRSTFEAQGIGLIIIREPLS